MVRFRFRLERVLEHRRMEEKKAEDALALARKEHLQVINSLEDVRQMLQQSLNANNGIEKIDLHQSMHSIYYREHLNTKILSLQEKMTKTAVKVEKEQKKLVEARQKCLVLEKLKQKQFDEFIYRENMHEQKQIDELALTGYVRSRN